MEQRAFRLARYATGNEDDAVEIVQDTMLGLAKRYAGKDETDWPALFHRILQSRIRDWYRRQKIRNRWHHWFGGNKADSEGPGIEQMPEKASAAPTERLAQSQFSQELERAIEQLPVRQQQAFLLRLWEGLDVAATAKAMGCSPGSVKTHYSRALARLRQMLEAHRP